MDDYLKILSPEILNRTIGFQKGILEIRARTGKKLKVLMEDGEKEIDYIVTAYDVNLIVKKISQFSRYAFDEEIRNGFITVRGGHRVGLCGTCVIENGGIKTIRNISSLNIRRASEVIGCSDKVIDQIIGDSSLNNTIIISPPRCGKTTLLRDLARVLSDRFRKNVCVIDERGEIGACSEGVPQLRVGERTDVFDRCPKSSGIMLAIRSLAPDVIICDEIGTEEDMKSIIMARNAGVKIITSIHGFGIEDLIKRKVFSKVVEHKIFKKAIVMNNLRKIGDIAEIVDLNERGVGRDV